ncbi:Pyruvate/Phosphoenolpyruvate kinase-like domain-containing protein [Melanogaster broomeanus]|nr:Pyruvate/Phosphoenolpyruvate kinase-like domain-containing protein [Melanogaster broomeanus]
MQTATALRTLSTSSRSKALIRSSVLGTKRDIVLGNAPGRFTTTRPLSTPASNEPALCRSYLYVPASSDNMLEKSLSFGTPPDVVIFDLEDSVPPSPYDKKTARERLNQFLHRTPEEKLPPPSRVAVRLNDVNTPFFADDISEILRCPSVGTLVLPKIHSVRDLHYVSRAIRNSCPSRTTPLRIVASIESARSVFGLGEIASWKSEFGAEQGGELAALLFAAEDYCADTSVVRTTSRQELLFVRSQVVIAAKAFGLEAIDMVCVNYKDQGYLREECEDGRRLGFTGKQAIHPNQVEIVNSTFVPTSKEILRAVRILHQMNTAHSSQKGAFGLEMEDGGKEMIDTPMLKQAENTIRLARVAGLDIPHAE